MHTLLNKLNWKQLALLDLPATHPCILQMEALQPAQFFIVFAATRHCLEQTLSAILPQAESDAILWMVYPKKSSGLYAGELSRAHGWDSLRAGTGIRCVRWLSFKCKSTQKQHLHTWKTIALKAVSKFSYFLVPIKSLA